jgi:cytochrome c oxidase subunit 3
VAEGKTSFPYSSLGQQNEAVTLGMWVLLATEALMFGVLFLSYTVYRYWFPQGFASASAQLDLTLGTLNTGVLLTSSLTMMLAVQSLALQRRRSGVWLLLLTALLGTLFLVIKGYAWHGEYQRHLVPLRGLTTDYSAIGGDAAHIFFNLYFVMTGLHALHLLIGVALVLGISAYALRTSQIVTAARRVRLLGLYWHFIDIIWLFLFPLLYLLRS